MALNTTDLTAARRHLDDMGGWLLDLGDGCYMATDDEHIVRAMRGAEFIARCEATQCWDETASTPA